MKTLRENQKIHNKKAPRYAFIDALRGICVVSMIAYHTLWDCVYIFGMNVPWFRTDSARIWQQSICWMFIFLSGFCRNFGTHHLKRGLLVFGGGAVITAVTLLVMPDDRIIFGVLTLLGTCMLLMIPLEKILKKTAPVLGLILNFFAFILTKNVQKGYIGIGEKSFYYLPRFLYRDYFTTFLGFRFKGFISEDYFPLIPWLFLFVSGYFFFRVLSEKGIISRWKKTEPKKELFTFIGRNSFWIYMAHQPLAYGILYVVFNFVK